MHAVQATDLSEIRSEKSGKGASPTVLPSSLTEPPLPPGLRAGSLVRAEALFATSGVSRSGLFSKEPGRASHRAAEGLGPVTPPSPRLTPAQAEGAQSFAARIDELTVKVFDKPDCLNLANLSADRLLSLFLMLNITDPNNAPETHNALYEISSTLRQQGLSEAGSKALFASEEAKAAMNQADQMKNMATSLQIMSVAIAVIGIAITVAIIVVAIVVSCCTLGTGTPAAAAVGGAAVAGTVGVTGAAVATTSGTAATATGAAATAQAIAQAAIQAITQVIAQLVSQAAAQAVQQVLNTVVNAVIQGMTKVANAIADQAVLLAVNQCIQAAIQAVLSITQAYVQHEIKEKACDVQESENGAERARHFAEKHQANVEGEAEILTIIMEAKNNVVDIVLKMTEASAATQMKVASCGRA